MWFSKIFDKFKGEAKRLRTRPDGGMPLDPVFEALANQHVCPDCKGDKFLMGPQGAMSQNVKCSNCGSEFVLAPFEDGVWLDPAFIAKRISDPMPNFSKKA